MDLDADAAGSDDGVHQSAVGDRAHRAAAAERAVLHRHARRLWAIPGTRLGVNSWPATVAHRLFLGWNYWWQAHLLDCLVDAEIRAAHPARRLLVGRLIRGIRLANAGRWTNSYFDDMAWLGLALQRADEHAGTRNSGPIRLLTAELIGAWSDDEGGGIPWRRGDEFKNTPANGPAAILLARSGNVDRAVAAADWIDERLRDPDTGLIWDGLRPAGDGRTRYERTIYSYCQGVVLGAELELAQRVPGHQAESARRIHRLVAAVEQHLAPGGVLAGHAGGDSGLFTGILARYLALVALRLPGATAEDHRTRSTAGTLLLRSADAAWTNAGTVGGGLPVFGLQWSQPARSPSDSPARDLSVQLAGWMLLESAHALTRGRAAGKVGAR